MPKERFSKQNLAKFSFHIVDYLAKKNNIDLQGGTSQFRKDLLSVLRNSSDEHLYEIIDKIVDYGDVRRLESIIGHYDLKRPKDDSNA